MLTGVWVWKLCLCLLRAPPQMIQRTRTRRAVRPSSPGGTTSPSGADREDDADDDDGVESVGVGLSADVAWMLYELHWATYDAHTAQLAEAPAAGAWGPVRGLG